MLSEANMPVSGLRSSWCNPIHVGVLLVITGLPSLSLSMSTLAQEQPARLKQPKRPVSDSAILDQAKRLIRVGDPQSALSVLQQADLQGANASDIHAMKGICLALLAKPVESEAEFDQAIVLHPNHAPTYFSSGLAYASFNNLDRALDRLATALKLDPKLPGVRYNYALVLARAGKFAESEEQTDLELKSTGAKTESVLELWRLKARDAYYQKEWQKTIDAYRKILKLNPDNPEAYGAIGEALFSLNRSEESQAALEKAVALDPDNGAAHAFLGKLYMDDGRQEQATAELEAALRLRPNDQEAASGCSESTIAMATRRMKAV